jgi:hypothetical protein
VRRHDAWTIVILLVLILILAAVGGELVFFGIALPRLLSLFVYGPIGLLTWVVQVSLARIIVLRFCHTFANRPRPRQAGQVIDYPASFSRV